MTRGRSRGDGGVRAVGGISERREAGRGEVGWDIPGADVSGVCGTGADGGEGDWNLRKRMAEFDPDRYTQDDRDKLGGPTGTLQTGGHRLTAKEWKTWRDVTSRRNQRWRSIIICEKEGRGEARGAGSVSAAVVCG
jgi:hypothetical protein